jgi:hypothetical protein
MVLNNEASRFVRELLVAVDIFADDGDDLARHIG